MSLTIHPISSGVFIIEYYCIVSYFISATANKRNFNSDSDTFILRNIHKTVANRAALFGSNIHESFVNWGFARDPIPMGNLQCSSRLPSSSLFIGLLPGKERREKRTGREAKVK